MPGGWPRNPDIVFGIGQNLTVRWPRIATRKKLKSGASRFHWLGLHLVKRTQRPLAIEQSWQEMQWNKILDEYWLKCQINFKKVPFAKWLSATVVLFDDIQCCLRVANGIWLWWYSMQWKSSLELMTCVQLEREPTAKYYYWTGLRACATKRCHRCFQIKFVNIEQGEQNCVVPPSICYCQHSQRALLWAIGHTPPLPPRGRLGHPPVTIWPRHTSLEEADKTARSSRHPPAAASETNKPLRVKLTPAGTHSRETTGETRNQKPQETERSPKKWGNWEGNG